MANSFGPPGQVSPTMFSRTLERVFEDAQQTGEINLSGRKLKEYSKVAEKFDLVDTTTVDLSKNRFTEIPPAVTATYQLLEQLNCYHNMIRTIPASVAQLQCLVQLNLSRNLLSHIPPILCRLRHLEVLLATNNKLVSLPEEIAELEHLMELDVSCNELTHLPVQIGDVRSLRRLNVRCNRLVELPEEISRLSLETLDCSSNKITHIPLAFRNMDAMERLLVADNPLVCPPAQLCSRGRVHITKYLQNEALKEDRKRGILNEVDMMPVYRQPASVTHPISNGYGQYTECPMDKRKYRQAVDSGYRSTDSLEKCRWSPSNSRSNAIDVETANAYTLHAVTRTQEKQQHVQQEIPTEPLVSPGDESPTTSLRSFASLSSDCSSFVSAVENPNKPTTSPDLCTLTSQDSFSSLRSLKSPIGHISSERTSLDSPVLPGSPQGQRSTVFDHSETHNRRSAPLQNSSRNSSSMPVSPSMSRFSYDSTSLSGTNSDPYAGYKVEPQDGLLDEFTRELQRQKSEYEAKKAAAAELRRQIEQEDEERRARERQKAARSQEEEEDSAGREREERRRAAVKVQEEQKALMERQRVETRKDGRCRTTSSSATDTSRRVGLSHSFKEAVSSQRTYKRTVSETPHTRYHDNTSGQQMVGGGDTWQQNNGAAARTANRQNSYIQAVAPDEELRLRREAMVSQQRHEAQMVRRRMEEEKNWIKKMQKDAVYGYVNRRTHQGKASDDVPCSYDTSLNSSFTSSTDDASSPSANFDDSNGSLNSHIPQMLPETCRRKLEAMSDELNSLNPAFTIRRQYQQAQEEREHVEMLRQIIESRLKVVLPDDLPSALRDGVVLCHLANHLRPRSVASIHVPSHATPKLSMAKCRKNVDSFLEACRRMGIDQATLCPAVAVLDENGSGLCDVAVMVRTLVEQASRPSQTAV